MEKGKEMVKAQDDLFKRTFIQQKLDKSLAGTIQQVISKVVTSPTDAKIDFAQGVNHITGDPQQKSAGPCFDAMQSLKDMNMKLQNEKDEDKMEAYEEADKEKMKKETEDKEKKDMKEVRQRQRKRNEKRRRQEKRRYERR